MDKVLLAVLVVLFAIGFFGAASLSGLAARLGFYLLGLWMLIRILRKIVKQAIWSLRNRLLVAYGFIAVLPLLLILMLAGLALYAILGQMAVYMVLSEFERRTAIIVATARHLAEDGTPERIRAFAQSVPVLSGRLPGVEIRVDGESAYHYPDDSKIGPPAHNWGDAGGLFVKDGLLYAGAHIVRPARRVTVLLPLSSTFLASLAPNIGEVLFTHFDEDPSGKRPRLRLHRSTADPSDLETPRNRIPDPEHALDIEILWATATPAFLWEQPGKVENELVRIRTRPFAVLRTIFANKVDVWQDLIPATAILLLGLFFLTEIASIVIGVSITRTITGAVHGLYEGTERVRIADFSHRIAVKGNDQLASLADSFNSMTANIERLLVVAKENERLQAELEIAKEVQAQLYPRKVPELRTVRLTAMCNPARMVSGDYYDFQTLDERRVALAIGDVAGKGISAALLMATVQSALRTELRNQLKAGCDCEAVISCSQLVSHLNQHLYAHTSPEKYATFCFGVYDEVESVLTYTNAGHLPPILMRNGQNSSLDVNGTVVGAFPFSRYQESSLRLESGDLLLFYTDGITEAENAYGEQFGEERLCELLQRHTEHSPDEILKLIIAGVSEWTNSPDLQDDMTLLVLQRI
ncbi:MAG: SpoIIE family protein phosphatase [Acidobacteria bacterium]|nr:SpoIIE family protein phosphatase [Acidobacteriota bacterium]